MKRAGLGLLLLLAGCTEPSAPADTGAELSRPEPLQSGSTFLQPDTRALQEDDFANPGMLWVERGEALFHEARDGHPACASCHEGEDTNLAGVAAHYPAIDDETGELMNIEARINACRTRHQSLEPLAYESEDLLALTAYVAELSRGEPIEVDISGAASPWFEKGRDYFFTRRGQLNLACTQCHDDNWGKQLRGDTISQGHGTGFPGYRLEWQTFGSLQRRLRDCDAGVRAEPLDYGSDDYLAVELYLAKRAEGLPLESPGVRR
ncbi:sulfur oxidation c-type cytochrome SoxA [Henriciella litoralis]|uniref:sulfur oxidation c-type cytochrome SoxA n=1 Tax=Henriciella litoralis TaxID=568102 RepID=UPI000A03CCCD|nr:sulfur oxidation c-type cytochrome SoxA [Henriciella litoralis]